MTTQAIDMAAVEAFAGRLLGILSGGSQTLLISIAHQTGLFDTLATLPPSTSQQIAEAAGLQERYVREWLAGMVVSRLIDYTPANQTYTLPPVHAALLTRAAGAKNMAPFAQLLELCAAAEQDVVNSFRTGGGVPYAAFPGFTDFIAQLNGPVIDATLVQSTLPLVPGLVEQLQAGIDVADVGCGAGHAVNVMAQSFPASRFTGFDFSEDGINAGEREAQALGLTNAHFELRDVATLTAENVYDVITAFDAIHDQAQPKTVLKAIQRALRPGGTYLMADIAGSSNLKENIDHPLASINYAVSLAHCMSVSLAQDGEGLGNMWGEQKAVAYLEAAGFRDVRVKKVEGDILNNFYIGTKR